MDACGVSLSKNYPNPIICDIIITDGGILYGTMEKRRTARANHCRFGGPGSKRPFSSEVMDYGWLYERLDPYYCHDNGRPGTDPVVLIKMVLIQHLFGIPSLRQTYREIQVNVAYRWFLGYGLLDNIPHFATVS